MAATYSGDSAFSSGGATRNLTVTAGSGASAIMVTRAKYRLADLSGRPGPGMANHDSVAGSGGRRRRSSPVSVSTDRRSRWRNISPLRIFPPTGRSMSTSCFAIWQRRSARTFVITGIDSNGQTWSRSAYVNYAGQPSVVGFNLTATPLTVTRNTADPACEWPVQVNVDELDGFGTSIIGLWAGSFSLANDIPAIFGTSRLNPWGSLQGVVCFNGITPPASSYIEVDGSERFRATGERFLRRTGARRRPR